ncbi:hypothetical protein Ahy_B03g063330 [Arachis hypogaea]|uniref:GTD-binding domain-containing protein n=1 Tax=Arachis hypogaea TaxID=3818 RepID=A0A444ZWV0_ARAHY|nr:hypothetical protein Ahy_B03g063330 [Arachis hypogaea]
MTFAPAFSFLTELGCGYVLLSCFSRLLNLLGMFLMLTFCIKFLRFAWHAKNHFRFFCDSGGIPRYRIILDYDTLPEPPKSKVAEIDPAKSPSITGLSPSKRGSRGNAYSEEASDTESLIVDEDDVFDVISLRRLVKMERRKANVAWSDLEKERTAAASSAEEAMAMILRLQNEKSSAEIESNQFRRMADERQGYEQELIEELQWTINQHEIQKNILEDQMGWGTLGSDALGVCNQVLCMQWVWWVSLSYLTGVSANRDFGGELGKDEALKIARGSISIGLIAGNQYCVCRGYIYSIWKDLLFSLCSLFCPGRKEHK